MAISQQQQALEQQVAIGHLIELHLQSCKRCQQVMAAHTISAETLNKRLFEIVQNDQKSKLPSERGPGPSPNMAALLEKERIKQQQQAAPAAEPAS